MRFWGDAVRMPTPDEFIVMVLRRDGCRWEEYGTYPTRTEAMEAIDRMDRSRLGSIGVQPHCKEAGPFQTHAMQVVWEA